MKTILITGLDGSGKSTFFKELKGKQGKETVIIELPKIDLQDLDQKTAIYPALAQLNELSDYADNSKSQEAKALAFFGAMLCFHDLLSLKKKEDTEFILCERHPLIDTTVYARFYSPKLNPEHINQQLFADLDQNFEPLLNYMVLKLPVDFSFNYTSPSAKLFQFIFEFFKEKIAPAIAELEKVFKVGLPDKVYFLLAPAEILFERLSGRKQLEPHESLSTLSKLKEVYESDLELMARYYDLPVSFVDASSFDSLEEFRLQFEKSLTTQTIH